MSRGGDFGEHLANVAASGGDITAPVPLFPTIGPTEERRYIAIGRRRRAFRKANPIFTTGGSLAANKERGDRRSQGQWPHAQAVGGETPPGDTR